MGSYAHHPTLPGFGMSKPCWEPYAMSPTHPHSRVLPARHQQGCQVGSSWCAWELGQACT